MIKDDVADHSYNPFPGKLFNKDGNRPRDVYPGCNKDFTGRTVTARNFIKVLTGDSSAPGPVLRSDSNDNVFVYYSDHGASGLVAMPDGYLYANTLNDALKTMDRK